MPHDFKKFPELTWNQMNFYYNSSPHKQIVDDFTAKVVRVKDGDTLQLRWSERDFDFPLRMIPNASPELKEVGGIASQKWLEQRVLNQEVDITIDPNNRIEKWGRLLGRVMLEGIDIGEESIITGHGIGFEEFAFGNIPSFEGELNAFKL